jgi:hypothetical protein
MTCMLFVCAFVCIGTSNTAILGRVPRDARACKTANRVSTRGIYMARVYPSAALVNIDTAYPVARPASVARAREAPIIVRAGCFPACCTVVHTGCTLVNISRAQLRTDSEQTQDKLPHLWRVSIILFHRVI